LLGKITPLKRENMTEIHLKDVAFNDMEWFNLAHDMMQRPWVLDMVMKLWVP
jgi:hypothetical protein